MFVLTLPHRHNSINLYDTSNPAGLETIEIIACLRNFRLDHEQFFFIIELHSPEMLLVVPPLRREFSMFFVYRDVRAVRLIPAGPATDVIGRHPDEADNFYR